MDPHTYTTHDHHTSQLAHSQSGNRHSVHHKVETWDLALSRNLLVPPYYKHLWVQGNTDPRSHWT